MHVHATGNTIIDGSHALLAGTLRELAQCLRLSTPEQPCPLRPERLRAVLIGHFRSEEAVLCATGYDGWQDHAVRHADLLCKVDTLLSAAATAPRPPTLALVSDLEALLWEHELVEDSDYWGVVNAPPPFNDWNADWLVGHARVDAHHRALYDLAGLVLGAAARKADFSRRLDMFMHLAAHHFDSESRILADLGCPETERHTSLHQELVSALQAIHGYDPATEQEIIASFLLYWLKGHIIAHDKPLFAALG